MRKKKRHSEHHVDESWLIPYADMLTLLLALFIVLFAMSEVDAKKYEKLSEVFQSEFMTSKGIIINYNERATGAAQKDSTELAQFLSGGQKKEQTIGAMQQLQEIQQKIDAYIQENGLADVLKTVMTEEGLLISIFNDVSFDSGRAEVSGKGKQIAEEMSHFLVTNPPLEIMVSGHTDNQPIIRSEYASNWELSVIRAVNFLRILLHNEQLDPERFSVKGFGEHRPVAPNDTKENRAKNRRVEVLILPHSR